MQTILDPKLPFKLVRPTRWYIDTVGLFLPTLTLPDRAVPILSSYSGKVIPRRCVNERGFFGHTLWVHQPTRFALFMIEQYQHEHDGSIFRLDIPADLFPDDLQACRNWVIEALRLKYQPGPKLDHEGTIYWKDFRGGKTPTRNIGLYADLLSKVNDEPCVHVELKLHRARTLRLLGIDQAYSKLVKSIDLGELIPRLIQADALQEVFGLPTRLETIRRRNAA